MTIPVIVVDDEELDRYLVKRLLAKVADFGDLLEVASGDSFIEQYFASVSALPVTDTPILVLMDVNMPGRNGFETIEEAQKYLARGQGPHSLVIMMFTSSSNALDRERANELELVKGYITKPLDKDGIKYILDVYNTEMGRLD